MKREFASAVLMSVIIIMFIIPLASMTGEAQIFPNLLIILMTVFNLCQYLMAYVRHQVHKDVPIARQAYPYQRVGLVFMVTLAAMGFFERFGFYPVSFVFFLTTALIAQPMAITWPNFAKRVGGCGAFVLALYLLFTVGLKVQIP